MSSQVYLRQIDDISRNDHTYLRTDDYCYYLREYIPRAGYSAGATNDLILNLKKSPSNRGAASWRYKGIAIRQCASELAAAVSPTWLPWLRTGAVVVPIPPSAHASDPLYDDRMVQVGNGFAVATGSTCSEVLYATSGRPSQHLSPQQRLRPHQIEATWAVNPSVLPARGVSVFVVLDDVLTTGANFKAAKSLLFRRFPTIPTIGLFVARVDRAAVP